MSRDSKVYLEDIGINVEVVWDVVEHKLPGLEAAARNLLKGDARE